MKIAGTDFDLNNNAIWIYISGCNAPHCKNCHNSILWDFDVGKNWETWKHKLHQYGCTDIVKNFWVLGGEPLDNNVTQLELLLKYLSQFKKSIMLWTRYELKDIPGNIKKYLDFAKTGEYISSLDGYEEPLFGIKLSSSNQKIIRITK